MAEYGSITRFVSILESASAEQVADVLYHEFMPACYDLDVLDHDYRKTLEHSHINGNVLGHSNIESFGLEECVASLTLILRKDRGSNGFSKPLLNSLEDGVLLRILKRIGKLDLSYRRPNVVTFYREYERDGYLSNWYKSPFDFCGNTFPTGEHWMMWHKALLFRDRETADRILEAAGPDEVKQLGRQVKPYVDAAWEEVRVPVMRVGLRRKFAQNERLANDLLSTGSAVLAEAAPNDRTWGVGIAKGDPKLDDPLNWHGRNLLASRS